MDSNTPQHQNQQPWRHALWFTLTCLFVVGSDLLTKWWIFLLPEHSQHLTSQNEDQWLQALHFHWIDTSWIEPAVNKGAAFSIGSGTPWLIIILTVVLVPVICGYYWLQIRKSERIWEHLAFALIIGGALGNAWDRLYSVLPLVTGYGGVRDFIHIDFKAIGINYAWPTFNIADCGITVGAILALVMSLTNPGKKPGKTSTENSSPEINEGTSPTTEETSSFCSMIRQNR